MGERSACVRKRNGFSAQLRIFPIFINEGRDLQHEEVQEEKMSGTRRRFFHDAAIFGAGLLGMSKSLEAQAEKPMRMHPREANQSHARGPGAPLPMVTPDVADLPNEMNGEIGFFVAHPQKDYKPRADHDYGLILQEWAVLPSNTVPNTAAMEFNWLTFNGVSAPMTTPLLARLGSRVRLRIVNLGMDHHPIHLHGHQFVVTGTEGGRAPESTWYPMNTVLVGVAQARVLEFEAKYPGAWMIHCHLPHHMMNSMMDLLRDRQIETADQTDMKAMSQMESLAKSVPFEHVHHAPIAQNAESVLGFPQDAFMEMGMDEVVEKPETEGLPKNWSAGMMGMMTMMRVLPVREYDAIVMKKQMARELAQDGQPRKS